MKKRLRILIVLLMLFTMNLNGIIPSPFHLYIQANEYTYTKEEIVEFAKQQYGKPYISLTEGPNSFDCTGFVKYVYNHFGIAASRTMGGYSLSNYSAYGTYVAIEDLEPGDIVIYGTSESNLTHAAIYVGDGLIINALNPYYGVFYNYVNKAAVSKYPGHNTFALNVAALYGVRPYGRIEEMGKKVDLGHSFTAEIIDTATSKLVSVSSTNVVLSKRSSTLKTAQRWLFSRSTDGSYIIQNEGNQRALDVTNGYIKENTPIKNATLNTALKRQKFYLQQQSDGSYVLRPMISNEKVFSIISGKAALASYMYKSGQTFKIVKKDQITIKYHPTKGSGTQGSTIMNFGKVLTLKNQGSMKRDGYEFQGWYAYRDADKKYYCGSKHKWQTSAAIAKYGYRKTVFKANSKYTMDYSWVKSKHGKQTIRMKASWKKVNK